MLGEKLLFADLHHQGGEELEAGRVAVEEGHAAAGELRGVATYASLRGVLDHYRAGDWHADIALVTGDLIHDDTAEAYGHFADLLGGLAGRSREDQVLVGFALEPPESLAESARRIYDIGQLSDSFGARLFAGV